MVNLSPKTLSIATTAFNLPVLEFSIKISLALMISAYFLCQTTLHLFFRGRNYFGRHGGVRARPLNIYFFEVVIILGVTVVIGQTTLHLFFRGCNIFGRDGRGHNNFEGDKGKRARPDHSTFIFLRS